MDNQEKEGKKRRDDRMLEVGDLKYMNIPASYWEAQLVDNYDNKIVAAVNNVLETLTAHTVVVICGKELSGRTSLAALYLMEAWRKHCSCYMVNNEYLWNERDTEFSEGLTVLERCRGVGVLVIDDICTAGNRNEYQINVLRTVLRHRTDWKKPTILIFGVETEKQIIDLLPVDLVGMIKNSCQGEIYELATDENLSTIKSKEESK
jgi:DNA replication protein DnaC